MHRAVGLGLAIALGVTLTGCPGGTDRADTPADRATPATDAAPGVPARSADVVGALPPGVTMEMVNQGQQLYGTVCVACHGPGGNGTPLAPALNDNQWINTDGSYDQIVNVIQVGVPQPRQYPAPMPPLGGGSFNADQVRSIAAYVYTLSH